MSGGDDGAPSPLHGGEFLLHLLRNPPQQPRQPPPQNMSHDPAVAAVGPSVAAVSPSMYQNSSHNQLPYNASSWSHSPPQFAPHNYFLQNPNPNSISASPGLDQYMSHNHQCSAVNSTSLGADNVIKMATFTQSRPVLAPQLQQQQQQQQQEVQSDLMFGSFDMRNNAGVSNLNGNRSDVNLRNRVQNGLEIEFQKSLDLNPNNNLHRNSRQVPAPGRRPPPGFSSNAVNLTNRSGSLAQNMSKGKTKTGELKHRNVSSVNHNENEKGMGQRMSGERGLSGQLDSPGLPSGSKVHSAKALDVEESQKVLCSHVRADQVRREDDQVKSEVVDSEGMAEALVLEDDSAYKEDKNKDKVTRDKEYRSDKRGQWILNQRMRISKRRIECRSDIYRLNNPFLEIYESLIPSDEERAKQKQLLSLLEKHVNKEWPGARLYLYGSCANSFGFRKSDIDVCLAIDDTDVNKSEVLLKLAEILQSDNLENVQALTRARVPIVKLKDPVTGIACDICVNNLLAVINTKLLRDYAFIDKRLRQLAFIIKHWAKSRGVNETYQGTLSSYAYVLMCINFLQQRRPAILPCLQRMERTYAVHVDNAECAYFDQVDKLIGFGSQNRETVAQLVWEFFNYWAYYHDYTNEVISVRTGRTISKHEKDWTRRVGNDRHLICIEDPFEISHDLGRVVDKHSIRVLREEFERAAEVMQYSPDPCVDLFEPYLPA